MKLGKLLKIYTKSLKNSSEGAHYQKFADKESETLASYTKTSLSQFLQSTWLFLRAPLNGSEHFRAIKWHYCITLKGEGKNIVSYISSV